MTEGPNFTLAESPIRKEAMKEVMEERNFEVCQPKESVLKSSRLFNRKKYLFTHLKENDDGSLEWNLLIVPPNGEPTQVTFDC